MTEFIPPKDYGPPPEYGTEEYGEWLKMVQASASARALYHMAAGMEATPYIFTDLAHVIHSVKSAAALIDPQGAMKDEDYEQVKKAHLMEFNKIMFQHNIDTTGQDNE